MVTIDLAISEVICLKGAWRNMIKEVPQFKNLPTCIKVSILVVIGVVEDAKILIQSTQLSSAETG